MVRSHHRFSCFCRCWSSAPHFSPVRQSPARSIHARSSSALSVNSVSRKTRSVAQTAMPNVFARIPCSGFRSLTVGSPSPRSFPATSLATIPFRITSFADPRHVTLIESHSYKKQGRGWRYSGLPLTQTLPLFSTANKRPTHSSARNSTLFMHLLHTSRHARGGGIPSNALLHFSALRAQSVFPNSSVSRWDSQSWLSSSGLRSLRSSPREAKVTSALPQNFYPPASDLRHNPAAQGHVSARLNKQAHSSSQTGRIQ